MVTINHSLLLKSVKITALRSDLLCLYGLARFSRAKVIVEVGVRNGGSTTALMLAAQENNSEAFISIDIRKKYGSKFAGQAPWEFVHGDSRDPELPEKCGIKENIDLFFLDSSHQVEDTKKELQIWMPHIVDGGYAAFHDTKTFAAGVRDPLLEYIKEQENQRIFWRLTELGDSPHGFTYVEKDIRK